MGQSYLKHLINALQCTQPLRDMQALGRRASCKEDNERKDREDWAYMQVILAHFPAYPNTYLSLYKTYLPACLPACMPTYLSELYMMSIWRLMIDLSGSTRRSLATWRTNMKTWKLFSKCLTLTRSPQSQIASFVTTCVFSSGRSGELEGGLRHATLCRIWPSCEHSLTILCLCRYWELN